MRLPIGSQKISASGVIGESGHPIRVYGFIVNADGSGTTVTVYNGTDNTGPAMDSLVGAASVSTRIFYPGGLYLPSGCYIGLDGHTTYLVAIYSVEG